MDVQIKKAVKAGNSSAVILPRSWLNKEVRVELTRKNPESILSEVLGILNDQIDVSKIIGIYLTGSYARGEEDDESDIDVLVVTHNIDREAIHKGIYSIMVISSSLVAQKLKEDIIPIGPMLREAKPLLNSNYLDSINVKATSENMRWYFKTTEEKLKIIKKAIEESKREYVDDRVAYTLVLRIRTAYIIDQLIKNRPTSSKKFREVIKKVSGGNGAYESYLAIKNNSNKKQKTSIREAERLYEYLKKSYLISKVR